MIKRESGKRGAGEWASLARSPVLPFANDPLLRMIDHPHELAEDVFVRIIDCLELGVNDVAVTKCKLDVHLRFGGLAFGIVQLGNESRSVTALPPRLVTGKLLAQLVNAQSGLQGVLINVQISKMPDRFLCRFST